MFEKMKDKGPKLQFSMKKQTNEEVFEQYPFEFVPDSFTSIELKKKRGKGQPKMNNSVYLTFLTMN